MLCGDLSLRLRCADVESLSIGGGSIASVNAGGGLRLGPRSQGAWPGPAAYGLGGTSATLTDALLLLGRLPSQLSGGVVLDVAAPVGARAAMEGYLFGIPAIAVSQIDKGWAHLDAAAATVKRFDLSGGPLHYAPRRAKRGRVVPGRRRRGRVGVGAQGR